MEIDLFGNFQKMEEDKFVNILLLGETGTGKSTLINAFANYLDFSSLEEAKNASKLKCIIPARFTIRTDQGDVVTITLGEDHNENTSDGQSSTRGPQVHSFDYEDKVIQIIDTPGINDSDGAVDKDQENFESILLCLEQFKELHAICFVLKPDTTVLTAGFRYCLLELLSRLNCSAAENIMFVFTRTKGTDYDAPECLNSLHLLVREIKRSRGVEVPLRHKASDPRRNCFFMDNEGFKSFVALFKGYSLLHEFGKSWEVSNKAARDMIKYILGGETTKPLPPHNVHDTLVVNKARRLIYELSHPLKDVSEHVYISLDNLKAQQKDLEQEHITAAQLRQNLKITVPKLNTIELENPITVCASKECTEMISGRPHYKRRCHAPCIHILESINQTPLLRSIRLVWFCPEIDLLGICRICSCHVLYHMTIYYETQIGEEVIDDLNVKDDLSTQEGRIAVMRKAHAVLRTSHSKLKHEQEEIAKAIAKFACFIRANSICPVNDAYMEYLNLLINNENKDAHSDKELLERYKRMREEHIKYTEMFEQGKSEAEKRDINAVTPAEVMETYERLKKLPHTGKALAKMHKNVAKLHEKMRHRISKKEQLIQRIDSLIQRFDIEHSLGLINTFIQHEENGWSTYVIRKAKNSWGKFATYSASWLGRTVNGVTEEDTTDIANMDPPTLWDKIKNENNAGAMRKLYDTYRSIKQKGPIDM